MVTDQSSSDDEALLDKIFDLAIGSRTSGKAFDLESLLVGRSHLRQRAQRIVAMANEIAAGAGPVLPVQHLPVVPGFSVYEEVGRGGMGIVYRAQQESLGRTVALKVLAPLLLTSPRSRARFAVEARALARLRHPHIVTVHEVIAGNDLCAYAMEWIDGTTLAKAIEARDPGFDARRLARLGADIGRALAAVHGAGLVHRDVKPSNILLRADGTPLLSDFSLVQDAEHSAHTATGEFLGTVAYAAPEQLRGDHTHVGPRSDVYSLGVTLYVALTGQTPFGTTTTAEILRRIERGRLVPIAKLNPRVPRDLATIVTKAMDPAPQRRYATAADLADDLECFLHAEPILARPAGLGLQLVRWAERNPWQTAAMLILVVGATGTTLFAVEAIDQAAQALSHQTKAEAHEMLANRRAEENARLAREMRDLAATEATAKQEAQANAAAAKQRAEQLEQVLTLQEAQWSQVDIESMGVQLRRAVIERAPGSQRVNLEAGLTGVNFTSIAVGLLEQQLFDPALAAVAKGFGEQPLVKARLLQNLAQPLRQLGLLDRAMPPQAEALEIRSRRLGDDHEDTLLAMRHLAALLQDQGKVAQAVSLYRQVADQRRRILGNDHLSTLRSIGNVGVALQAQGKLVEAEPHLLEALEGVRRLLGPDHFDTLEMLHNVAALLQAQGKLDEAEPCLSEALEGKRRILGDDDPSTLASVGQMGQLLRAQGRLAEAERFYREALDGCRRVLGNDHPRTLMQMCNMGVLLLARGRFTAAESVLREALATCRRLLGDDHPTTLSSINNLGQLLQARGRLAEAEALLRESLARSRQCRGDDHPGTLAVLNSLGLLLKEQGRLPEAEPLAREAAERSRLLAGDDNSETLIFFHNLGTLLQAQGKFTEAEPLLRGTLEGLRRVVGHSHPNTLAAFSDLGVLLQMQGRPAEAVPFFREVLKVQRRVLGDDHPSTLTLIFNLGFVLQEEGKLVEAEPFVREALESRRRVLGADHAHTLLSIQNMGVLLARLGRSTEAERYCREALEGSRGVAGDEHPNTLLATRWMGHVLVQTRRHTEAIALLSAAEPAARRVFVGGHAHRLAAFLQTLGMAHAGVDQPPGFSAAESTLLEAHALFTSVRGTLHKDTRECAQALVELYKAWHTSAPSSVLEQRIGEWDARHGMQGSEPLGPRR